MLELWIKDANGWNFADIVNSQDQAKQTYLELKKQFPDIVDYVADNHYIRDTYE